MKGLPIERNKYLAENLVTSSRLMESFGSTGTLGSPVAAVDTRPTNPALNNTCFENLPNRSIDV
jgi:hypothetical protein